MDGRRARGFTLVELLVVMVAIAVLLAILAPHLRGSRECARAVTCLSNQRQIGIAMLVYAGVYREVAPREGYTPGRPCWPVVLRPYVDGNEPAGDLFEHAPYYRDPARPPDGHPITYVANGMPFIGDGAVDPNAEGQAWRRRGPTPLVLIQRPAAVVYLCDLGDDANGALWARWGGVPLDEYIAQWYDVWAIEQIADAPATGRLGPRRHYGHSAAANFFDGHAAMIDVKLITDTGPWDDGLRPRR